MQNYIPCHLMLVYVYNILKRKTITYYGTLLTLRLKDVWHEHYFIYSTSELN